jgi:glycosyltransferase involved in cell wall biosynthesis
MTPKRILITTAQFFPYSYGGGQVYTLGLAKELQRRGYEILVVTPVPWDGHPEPYLIRLEEFEGIPFKGISFHPSALTEGEKTVGLSPLHLSALQQIFSDHAPDVIHANGMFSPVVAIGQQKNVPLIVTVHHSGIVCPEGALQRPDGSLCSLKARAEVCVPCCSLHRSNHWFSGGLLGKLPHWIYSSLGPPIDGMRNPAYPLRVLRYPWLIEHEINHYDILWNGAQKIIAPSNAIKRLLLRNGVSEEKLEVIPHGIRQVPKTPIERITERPIRLGFIGQIGYLKGLHILLQAMEQIPQRDRLELHIYGKPQSEQDKRYYNDLLVRYRDKLNITDNGFVWGEQLLAAYRTIDILVNPSLAYEAFGLVVAESLAAGRPVIVSDAGALPEWVRDNVDGFVVRRNDVSSLARILESIIEKPEVIVEMSHRIPPIPTIEDYVDRLEPLYESLRKKQDHA